MINPPAFLFKTPQAFYENLVASQPAPKTGKPDPEKMAAFAVGHPETVRALGVIQSHSVSSGFDNSAYNSLKAFRFIDATGTSIPVRLSLAPVQPFVAASTAGAAQADKNYLFDGLIASMLQHPLHWHLIITLGQPGDATNDATVAWPDGRDQVDVGTLILDHVESEETSAARDIII